MPRTYSQSNRRHDVGRSRDDSEDENQRQERRRSRSRDGRDKTRRNRSRSVDKKERNRSKSKDRKERNRSRSRSKTGRDRSRSKDRRERRRSRSNETKGRRRSRSSDRKGRRKSRSTERSNVRRSRSRSRSDDQSSRVRETKIKAPVKSKEEMENEAAMIVAAEIKKTAAEEVEAYLLSEDFRGMVDSMKRRERERIMREVDEEMVAEKEKLLQDERKRIKAENERNQENTLAAADIVLQNKLIMEAQQRKEFEIKQVADSLRLEEMHRKAEQGLREEEQLAATLAREKVEKDQILLRHKGQFNSNF